jgi:hypothetical protein
MKKMSILMLMLSTMFTMLAVSFVFSAEPTLRSDDQTRLGYGTDWYERITTATKVALTGVGDTSTLLYRWRPKTDGADVVYVRGKIRGTNGDSVKTQVFIECLDPSYNLLYKTVVDTFVDSLGEAIKLPINGGAVGTFYNLKLLTITGHRALADSLPTYQYIYYPRGVTEMIGK